MEFSWGTKESAAYFSAALDNYVGSTAGVGEWRGVGEATEAVPRLGREGLVAREAPGFSA